MNNVFDPRTCLVPVENQDIQMNEFYVLRIAKGTLKNGLYNKPLITHRFLPAQQPLNASHINPQSQATRDD